MIFVNLYAKCVWYADILYSEPLTSNALDLGMMMTDSMTLLLFMVLSKLSLLFLAVDIVYMWSLVSPWFTLDAIPNSRRTEDTVMVS